MERIFQELLASPHLKPQGFHFSSMITAYGVKMQNLERAQEIFASVPQYLSRREAVVYEAMFDALRVHGRIDDVASYIESMNSEGVHMTAYIGNVLIATYSDAGRIDKARELFESLQDPPSAVAASGNHAPHDPAAAPAMHVMDPVYREVCSSFFRRTESTTHFQF